MRALSAKLWRDLVHLRGQMVAVAAVVACGTAALVTMRGLFESLRMSQATYYEQYRFADVFASLRRAPDALLPRIRAIPGVARVEARVTMDVLLDLPGLPEPATGRLLSLPADRGGMLNALHLRRGRFMEPHRRDEVVISEAFADASGLAPGDRIGAVINGRWERLAVVGVALSPEYVYEVQPGGIFPDNRRFGVLWMGADVLRPALDLDGAFNDLAIDLAPEANEAEVIARLDRLLAPYGGLGAYPRRDQVSHRFVSDEIAQHRVTANIIGSIFLGVSAFLLNLVLSRLVATQRDQVGTLKAFGYGPGAVAAHYLVLGLVPVVVGAVAGAGLGMWLARDLTALMQRFYRFPVFALVAAPPVIVAAILVNVAGGALGAIGAARRAFRLPPAEAMRAEAPAAFRATWTDRIGLGRLLTPAAQMVARSLERRAGRSALAALGLAFAVAILVVGRYFVDAIDYMADVQFRQVARQDATVVFTQPHSSGAAFAVARLPGVLRVEPFRAVPVRLVAGHRHFRTAILGLDSAATLFRLLDRDLAPVWLPGDGLVLTRKLGEILHVAPGDSVVVEVLEGARPVRPVLVAGLADELVGVSGYMRAGALHRLLREGPSLSGAHLQVDAAHADALYLALKRTPAVATVTVRQAVIASFEKTLATSLGTSTTLIILFAAVIAVGMVYNSARIALSERGRELASLRVLGFTRGEVSFLLFAEQGVLLAVALPLGWLLGYGICALALMAYDTELYRLPLVVSPASFGFSTLVVVVSALASALLVRQRIDRLDLVAVLKTRE